MFPILSPLTFFGLPLFHFLILCLSVLLLSFFLPSCLSFLAFFFFLVFVSLFCSFLCAFVSWKEQNENIKLEFLLFIKMFSFLGFLSCFLFEISFPYLCFFPDFELCFLFNIIVCGFKKPKLKNTNFGSKGGLQHNGVFYEPVLCKMWKVIVFWGFFLAIFWLFSKNTIEIGILAHFSKQKITKKWHFWKLLSGPSWKFLSGPSWLRLKKRQLGPDNKFQNFCAQFLFCKKKGWNPYFYSVFWQSVF